MSTSALTGSGSVIDVRGIVDKLMQIESKPLTAARQRVGAVNVSISAMSEVKALVDKVASSAKAMEDSLMLAGRSVASSDAALVKASVSNPVLSSPGTITVSNTLLAKAQRTAFAGFASSATVFGQGYGELRVRSVSSDFGSIADQSITLAGKTLEDIRNGINSGALGGKITASIVNTGDPALGFVLVLTGAKTGTTATFDATWHDAQDINNDGIDDDRLNYNGSLVSGRSSAYVNPRESNPITGASDGAPLNQAAADAQATVNGIRLRSKQNTFTDAVPGLSFDILKSDSNGSATVTVSDNKSALKDRLKAFAADFTAFNRRLSALTQPGSQNQKPGALSGNSGILSLGLSLYSAYTQGFAVKPPTHSGTFTWGADVSNAPTAVPTLPWSLLGLEWTREGSVTVNESVLNAAIDGTTRIAGVDRRLGDEMLVGFTSGIREALNGFRGVDGTIQSSINILQTNRDRISSQATDRESRLERTRKSLLAKYASLDSRLASMSQLGANVRSALSALSR